MSSPASSSLEAAAPSSVEATKMQWERAWSLEEVYAGSQCWSLAADAGLLHFLQDFSQQTISKMHEIKKQMDRLVHETKRTDCHLHNIFNGFLMLSNTQFIENRVYDDEMEEAMAKNGVEDKPEQEKTREQKEAGLILKIQEAVSYGLQVLDSNFEQLDIKAGNSDSEEETSEKVELILEPKDLYIDRPLPYLIGSQPFMEQDDVGLGEYSSEGTEGSVDSAHGSIIDSEGENEQEFEEELGDVSEEDQKLGTTVMSEEDEDLFGDSEKGEEEEAGFEENTQLKKKRPASFTEELTARIREDMLFKQEEEPLSNVKNKTAVIAKEEICIPSDDEEDIFKPPKLTDEDFSPFGSKDGLFSPGTALFDDESDLFVELPKEKDVAEKEVRIPINDEPSLNGRRKVPAGAVSLFPGISDDYQIGRNDIFRPSQFPVKKDVEELSQSVTDKVSKIHESISLFDDDNDFESNRKKSISAKSAADLFDAESNIFKKKPDVTSVINNSAKESKELMTDGKTKPSFADRKNLFSDEEDAENLFPSYQLIKPNTSSFSSIKSTTNVLLHLFEDEDEEELFKSIPKIQKSNTLQGRGTSLLFSSDGEVHEEDHCNIVEENKPVPECSQKKESTSSSFAHRHTKRSLFEDEGEDDLFVITTDSQKTSQKPALLFEDDAENGDSLFSFQPPCQSSDVHMPFSEKNIKRNVNSMFSLFEEEEKNEETDVNKTRRKEIPKPSEKTIHSKSTGVFQDEELLFNHKLQKDNDPEVDLFANCKKEVSKSRLKTSPGGELFGTDDGDDGLFNFPKVNSLANVDMNPEVLLPIGISVVRLPPPSQKTSYPESHGKPHIVTESVTASNREKGVSFDYPMQADTLQNANKDRIKITRRRRPPSTAARRLAAEESGNNEMNTADSSSLPYLKESSVPPAIVYPYNRELYGKESTGKSKSPIPTSDQLHEINDGFVSTSMAQTNVHNLFETNDLFLDSVASKVTLRSNVQVETEIPKSAAALSVPLILDDQTYEDIFQTGRPLEKSSPTSVLENKDVFTADKQIVKIKDARATLHSDQDNAIQDIFEEDIFASETIKVPAKAKLLEANLFGDDNDVDIFADLAVKPQKKNVKKKMETKSIFDENIDDIFSSSGQSKTSIKKAQSFQASAGTKSESRTSSPFEDPLNAFGGQ